MEPMLISAMDKPLQPWRNGGGVTRQLLAWPDDENWLLRISMANVSQDGSFSAWPGVVRGLAILDGEGVKLTFADSIINLQRHDPALIFPGEAMPDCQLLGGGVRDLNVMAREGDAGMRRVQSVIDWLPPAHAQAGLFTLCEGEWISGENRVFVTANTLLWRFASDGNSWRFVPRQKVSAGELAGWWIYYLRGEKSL